MRRLILGACVALCGCGGQADPALDGAGPAPIDPRVEAAAVQAVQAKVPAGLQIAFEAVPGEKQRHLAIQPKGWETGVIPGRVKPPAGSNLGFLSTFSTSSNCDGSCSPKDWAAVADKVEFAQFTGGDRWTIDKDEKLADGRLVVAKGADRVDIALARWREGADRYFVCRATLDKEIIGAAAAFEEACRQMRVDAW